MSSVVTPPQPPDTHTELAGVLARARLQALRAAVLICLLIAVSNLVNCIAAAGGLTSLAVLLAALWCTLWAVAAWAPERTARCLSHWQLTAAAIAGANMVTVGVTGGAHSPVMAVCMYVGWIASVVLAPRATMVISLAAGGSIIAGAVAAGGLREGLASHALTSALLPVLLGAAGILLASTVNGVLSRADELIDALRAGMPASTTAMTALFARTRIPIAAGPSDRMLSAARSTLTLTEREIVDLLADGHTPTQIAYLRDISVDTVRVHIKHAKRKTGARTIAQLIALAWTPPPPP